MKYAKYLLVVLLSMPVGYTFCGTVGDLANSVIVNKDDVDYGDVSEYYPSVGSSAYVVCRASIREEPSISSNRVKTIDGGECVTVLGYVGDWAVVPSGYLYGGLLSDSYNSKFDITSSDMESRKYLGYVYSRLSSLDSKLLEVVERVPIKLVMYSKDLNVDSTDVEPAGVTNKWTGLDVFGISVVCNTGPMIDNLVHELGHVIDYKDPVNEELYSATSEFQGIYNEEVESYKSVYVTSEHNVSYTREYFADCIKQYEKDKDELKENVPKTFEYINKVVGGK